MRLLLFSIALFIGVLTKAQTTDNLKDFINKNDIAIRSVHKNMIAQNISNYSDTFKELLIQQESAVKVFNTNREASASLAFVVRKACLEFLKKNHKGSTDFYEITSEEQKNLGNNKPSSEIFLSETELKTIQSLDLSSFQSISNLTLTIQ